MSKLFQIVRVMALPFVLISSLASTSCGDEDNPTPNPTESPYDLTFKGASFDPHEGQMLRVVVVDLSDGQVIRTGSATVSGGVFSFSWPSILQLGRSYRVDFYADINGNGECEPSDDHVWSVTVNGVSDDVAVSETHNTKFEPSACASFPSKSEMKVRLTFNGNGFGPHEGQVLSMALVRNDKQEVIKSEQAVVSGGIFSFSFDSALERGKSYTLDYYADVNNSGSCERDSDHVWRVSIPSVTGDVTITEIHSLNFTSEACDSF